MRRLSILLALGLIAGVARGMDANKVRTDSLADVFPLSIGNQWVYNYDYEFRDIGVVTESSDTGTVTLRIISHIVAADSTRWLVQETGSHWTRYNGGPWSGPYAQTDTFEIIEFSSGNHWMYRTGVLDEMRRSVLPFVPNLVDTARIYRYALVDTAGVRAFSSYEYPHAPIYYFTFRQGIGLESVGMADGMTGFPYYWTDHSLRSYTITGIADPDETELPTGYRLNQNYPNPFNPSTTFSFSLPVRTFVSLKVFDLLGREVATIVSEELQAGNHIRPWHALDVASGTYFLRLKAGAFTETRRLLLVK
jgi:hypothetical protein